MRKARYNYKVNGGICEFLVTTSVPIDVVNFAKHMEFCVPPVDHFH